MKTLLVLLFASLAYGADLGDLNFMTGRWIGELNGSATEEVWSSPDSGSMIGMYRESKDGHATFYELLVIEVRDNVPTLLLKHFDPGLKGWEEKDKAITLPLKEYQPNVAVFMSEDAARPMKLTYRRTGKSSMEAILERERKGEPTRLIIRYSASKR